MTNVSPLHKRGHVFPVSTPFLAPKSVTHILKVGTTPHLVLMIPNSQCLQTGNAYSCSCFMVIMVQWQHCVISSSSGTKGAAPIWDTASPLVGHKIALKTYDRKWHLSLHSRVIVKDTGPRLTLRMRGCVVAQRGGEHRRGLRGWGSLSAVKEPAGTATHAAELAGCHG